MATTIISPSIISSNREEEAVLERLTIDLLDALLDANARDFTSQIIRHHLSHRVVNDFSDVLGDWRTTCSKAELLQGIDLHFRLQPNHFFRIQTEAVSADINGAEGRTAIVFVPAAIRDATEDGKMIRE
ncbi:hypothetical protein LTR56_027125 [Elasticomyces elasticus]|nr:hypothetical protein LTR56_027125 [Elasticomyces elasticus]